MRPLSLRKSRHQKGRQAANQQALFQLHGSAFRIVVQSSTALKRQL